MNFKNDNLKIMEGNNKIFISNSNNKSWVRMNKSFYNKYISQTDNENNELLNILNKYSILEEDNGHLEYKFDINSVYVVLTKECNLECEFCSMKSNPRVITQDDLSFKQIKENLIPKIKEINPNRIILTGGEPILRKDLANIISVLKQELPTSKISLQTNGILITNNIIESIKDNISLIEISIENIFDNEKLLQLMISNLDLLKSNNIEIGLSFVVDNKNKKYIKNAIDLVQEYDTRFSMKLVSPIGYADENEIDYLDENEIFELYEEIVQYILENKYTNIKLFDIINVGIKINKSCGAYGKIISIYPNGDMFMCHSLNEDKFNIGNIINLNSLDIKDRIIEKVNSKSIKDIFIVDNIDICKECSIKYLCSGFCAAERQGTSDIKRLQVACSMKKIIAEFTLFYKDNKKDTLYNFNQFLYLLNKNSELRGCINANCE